MSDNAEVSPVNVSRETELTERVVASFANSPNTRLRVVMSSLVRHLHGFIREIRLSQTEWDTAIAFLTPTGHITDEHRQ